MTERAQVVELVVRWQELREQGQSVTLVELCGDCPELISAVQQQVIAIQSLAGCLHDEPTVAVLKEISAQELTLDSEPDSPRREAPRPSSAPLSGYEILEELGVGGMGVVHKARQIGLNRIVAIKKIKGYAGKEDIARFQIEAQAVARLQHPNFVQIYEIGEHEHEPFFSLEYCAGGSLSQKLRGTPLPPQEAARLTETLARAMHAAHQQNVVHRDLKPANILLTLDGTPKITDFGLAKKLDEESGQTHAGSVLGTPSYMAPEQAEGRTHQIGPAADIYALGAILYELLTGRPPFKAATPWETVRQVLRDEPVSPRSLQSQTPSDLETICLTCLHKDPARRYTSAATLADDLHRFQNGEPIQARPVGSLERAWRWCRRNQLVAGLIALVVVVLIAGTATATALALLAQSNAKEALTNELLATEKAKLAEEKEAQAQTAAQLALTEQDRAEKNKLKAVQEAENARREFDKAQKVSQFLTGLFDASDATGFSGYLFGPPPGSSKTLTALNVLDRGAEKIDKELQGEPLTRAAILTSLGSVYRNIAEYKKAERFLAEALALRRKHLPADHLDVGESWHQLGWLNIFQGEDWKAKEAFRQAIAIAAKHPDGKLLALRAKFHLGWVLAQHNQNKEAERLFREVLAERQKLPGDHALEITLAKVGLTAVLFQSHKELEAGLLVMETLNSFQKLHGKDSSAAALGHVQKGIFYGMNGNNIPKAEEELTKAIKIMEERLGENNVYTGWINGFLGEVNTQRNPDKAAGHFQRCMEIARRTVGLDQTLVLRMVSMYADVEAGRGKYEDGKAIFDEVLRYQAEQRTKDHPSYVLSLGRYAMYARRHARLDEADRLFQRALEVARQHPVSDLPEVHELLNYAALNKQNRGLYGAADKLFKEGLAAAQTLDDPDLGALLALNLAELRIGRFLGMGAEEAIFAAYRRMPAVQHLENRHRRRIWELAAEAWQRHGDWAKASACYKEELALAKRELAKQPLEWAKKLENAAAAALAAGDKAEAMRRLDELVEHGRRSQQAHPQAYADARRTAALVRLGQDDESGFTDIAEGARAQLKQAKTSDVAASLFEILLAAPVDSSTAAELLLQIEHWHDRAPVDPNLAALRALALVRLDQPSQALEVLDKSPVPKQARARVLDAFVRALAAAKAGRTYDAERSHADARRLLDTLCYVKPTRFSAGARTRILPRQTFRPLERETQDSLPKR